jgi:hypothetical protein
MVTVDRVQVMWSLLGVRLSCFLCVFLDRCQKREKMSGSNGKFVITAARDQYDDEKFIH